jgi:peptide/nickel transport system substrate-binding protein
MGPFLAPRENPSGGAALRLAANPHHARGRPFADALEIVAADARRAGRLLETGQAELVLRPEPHGAAAVAAGSRVVTVAALNAARLGAAAQGVRRVLAALDRTDLARRFTRGPSEPLLRIVPPVDGPSPLPPPPPPPERIATRPLRFLVHATAPDQRALAARIQVKLFDRGVRALVEAAEEARFADRLAAGDYDVALVPVPLVARSPVLVAAQVAHVTRGAAAARRVLAALAGKAPAEALAATEGIGRDLDLVPLVATGTHASVAPRLRLGADAGDLWLVGGGAGAP